MVIFIVLGLGVGVGGLVRLVTPGRFRLTWAESIVVALIGAGAGGEGVDLATGNGFDPTMVNVIGALAGAVVLLVVAELVLRNHPGLLARARRSEPGTPVPTAVLMASGENDHVEFKSSARHNLHTGGRDEKIEMAVVKTVAGFLNASGGSLLIGVDDDGRAVGLEEDYALVKRGDRDTYQLWLMDLLGACLGRPAAASVELSVTDVGGEDVCRVDVSPADRPVFANPPKGEKRSDFYLRMGNSTRRLLTDEVLEYQRKRW